MINASSNPNRVDPAIKKVVKNTRWIPVHDLKIGMYVRELDIPWEDTRFMFQGFVVDNYKLLRELQNVCETVCVESQKVATISATGGNRLCGATMRHTNL